MSVPVEADALEPLDDLLQMPVAELDSILRDRVRLRAVIGLGIGRILLALSQRVQAEPAAGWATLGPGTESQYLESVGLGPREGGRLKSVARACEASEPLCQDVVSARVNLVKAGALCGPLTLPELQKPGDDWLADARSRTTRELCEKVYRRKEEVRLKEPPTSRTLHLSRKALHDLEGTRIIVARRLERWASESEAASVAFAEFVERHDPERKAERAHRRKSRSRAENAATEAACGAEVGSPGNTAECPPNLDADAVDQGSGELSQPGTASNCHPWPQTGGRRRRRPIPAAERYEVISRFGMRCAVEGCDEELKLQFAHRRPVRWDGDDVASNLDLLCLSHHRLMDSGVFKMRPNGSAVILVDRTGVVVGRLRGPPAG